MKRITTESLQGLCLSTFLNSRMQQSTLKVLKRHQTVRSTPQRDVELKHQASGSKPIQLSAITLFL